MEEKGKLIAGIFALVFCIYIYLGFTNKTWNPLKGEFWTGKKPEEECKLVAKIVDGKMISVCKDNREGFMVMPGINPNEGMFDSINNETKGKVDKLLEELDTRPTEARQVEITNELHAHLRGIQNMLYSCTLMPGIHCDVDAPFKLYWHKEGTIHYLLYGNESSVCRSSTMPVPSILPSDMQIKRINMDGTENILVDVSTSPHWKEIKTAGDLWEMFNTIKQSYDNLTDCRKQEIKSTSKIGSIKPIWVQNDYPRLEIEVYGTKETYFVYKDITLGLFLMLSMMIGIYEGTWIDYPEPSSEEKQEELKDLSNGILAYRYLKKWAKQLANNPKYTSNPP